MSPSTGDDYLTADLTDDGNTGTWTFWTDQTATAADTSIWDNWAGEVTSADDQGSRAITFTRPLERTPREIRRQRLNDARRRGVCKQEEKQKAEAESRAKKLLMDLIGKTDYKKFLQLGYLDVKGNSGKTYRIRPGRRIEILEKDLIIDSLCITTPNYYLPEYDEVIWKKLLAENNEKLLLEVANHQRC